MGNTTVVCGVKAEISEPELDHDGDGFLGIYLSIYLSFFFFHSVCFEKKKKTKIDDHKITVPNLDLPAMCSPKFKPGPPTEEAQVLSDRLNQVLTALVFD